MSESVASTVWVHVTTLLNWNRPPVGIVRVEQEYCRWVLQHAPAGQVRFCAYDRVMRQFTEVDVAQVEARLRPVQPAPAASGPPRAREVDEVDLDWLLCVALGDFLDREDPGAAQEVAGVELIAVGLDRVGEVHGQAAL